MSSGWNNHQIIFPTITSHKNRPPIFKYELDQLISRSNQVTVHAILQLVLSQ